MRIKIGLLFLILLSSKTVAQKHVLGKVKKEEIMEQFHPNDSAAPAAILFKKAKTVFKYKEGVGFSSITEFEIKIKIYKKEGFSWANFTIPYYVGYENLNDEFIDILSACTYNLEGNEIVKEKVVNQSKFKKSINEYWAEKSITFPNVKVGSIIELRYQLKTENISTLPEFKFQYQIPVNYAEYITEIPEYYLYKGIFKGYIKPETTYKIEPTSQAFEGKVDKSSMGMIMKYNQVVTQYKAKDIPALKEEKYVNSINNYYAEIIHELELIRYPQKEPKQISTTWEKVAKSIYEDDRFGKQLQDYGYLLDDLRLIIKKDFTTRDKINAVYTFVKNRMNWDERYGYFTKKGVVKAYRDMVGNVAEINFILLSMLKMAGVDAYPVVISTRENGLAFFPNKTILNYVIVCAVDSDTTFLLDATDKNADLNILPIRDLNTAGRMIKDDGTTSEINLMPTKNSKEIINIMAQINDLGYVTGKVRHQYYDYNAYLYKHLYDNIAKENVIDLLEKKYEGVEILDYEIQDSDNYSKPITENYEFKSTNSIEIIGDKMYVSPFLFFSLEKNPFNSDTREYPIDFIFPKQDKFNFSIHIPEGFVLESLPNPKSISMPDGLANFKYNISNTGSNIQLNFILDINTAIVAPEYYEALKSFFKELVNTQTERIVLKKG